jgi:hypothetical protein
LIHISESDVDLVNITTFYTGFSYSLCSAEISKLERLASDGLELKDIHQLNGGEVNIDKSFLLFSLHLRAAIGEWITGLKANIEAWQHTCFGAL